MQIGVFPVQYPVLRHFLTMLPTKWYPWLQLYLVMDPGTYNPLALNGPCTLVLIVPYFGALRRGQWTIAEGINNDCDHISTFENQTSKLFLRLQVGAFPLQEPVRRHFLKILPTNLYPNLQLCLATDPVPYLMEPYVGECL